MFSHPVQDIFYSFYFLNQKYWVLMFLCHKLTKVVFKSLLEKLNWQFSHQEKIKWESQSMQFQKILINYKSFLNNEFADDDSFKSYNIFNDCFFY